MVKVNNHNFWECSSCYSFNDECEKYCSDCMLPTSTLVESKLSIKPSPIPRCKSIKKAVRRIIKNSRHSLSVNLSTGKQIDVTSATGDERQEFRENKTSLASDVAVISSEDNDTDCGQKLVSTRTDSCVSSEKEEFLPDKASPTTNQLEILKCAISNISSNAKPGMCSSSEPTHIHDEMNKSYVCILSKPTMIKDRGEINEACVEDCKVLPVESTSSITSTSKNGEILDQISPTHSQSSATNEVDKFSGKDNGRYCTQIENNERKARSSPVISSMPSSIATVEHAKCNDDQTSDKPDLIKSESLSHTFDSFPQRNDKENDILLQATRITSTQKPHDASDDDLPIEVSTKREIPSEVNQQFVCQGDSNKRSFEESDNSTSSPPVVSLQKDIIQEKNVYKIEDIHLSVSEELGKNNNMREELRTHTDSDKKVENIDRIVLFEQKCKLFQFDQPKKQWNEHGRGKIQIFSKISDERHGILMKNSQTSDLCCYHYFTPDMKIMVQDNVRTLVWQSTSDYSEEVPKERRFIAKFSSADQATKFKEIFQNSVRQLSL